MNEKCPNCGNPFEGNNLQKCLKCGIDILQYTREKLEEMENEKELLVNNERRIANNIFQKTWNKLIKVIWFWIGVIVVLWGFAVGLSLREIYKNVVNVTKNQIIELITKQFEEPRIRQTLTEVANTEAEDILANQVRPEIDSFKEGINKELDSVKRFSEDLKTKYTIDYNTFNLEVAKLKDRNRLIELGDMVIANRDVAAYKELERIAKDSVKPELMSAAVSEIKRVKVFFATMTSVKGASISYKGPLGSELKDNDMTRDRLIFNLKNDNWLIRVKAAQLLQGKKEKSSAEALLESMNNDPDMEVRKEALESFDAITGHISNDVFGFEAANEWWTQNKFEVDKKLK
ncbi:MAG: HEAT repeat domain-containing protein [Candidatus Omnitrophota bacterium]